MTTWARGTERGTGGPAGVLAVAADDVDEADAVVCAPKAAIIERNADDDSPTVRIRPAAAG